MPTSTYVALATYTVTGATDSIVEFASIPTTGYRDLVLTMAYSPTTTETAYIRLNSDTGSNYSRVLMYGTGSSAISVADTNNRMRPGSGVSGNQMVLTAQFLDCNATDKHKTVLTRFNDAGNEVAAAAFRWANTNAITTITIGQDASGSFNIGSTFSLYGIEA